MTRNPLLTRDTGCTYLLVEGLAMIPGFLLLPWLRKLQERFLLRICAQGFQILFGGETAS